MNKHPFSSLLMALLLVVAAFHNSLAEVSVARIFSDHMVLQRGINVPVWGTASPGEKITIEINGLLCTAVAGKDGNWKAYLPVFEAAGPYELMIKGSNEIRFTDVLFGDVWLASGQSNMAWRLDNVNNADEEVANAGNANIRLFTVPRRVGWDPKADLQEGNWEVCTPETAKSFSAVAYFFGKELSQDINVPIGLINCSWEGQWQKHGQVQRCCKPCRIFENM